jgi:hypothetical protein
MANILSAIAQLFVPTAEKPLTLEEQDDWARIVSHCRAEGRGMNESIQSADAYIRAKRRNRGE